MTTKIPRIIQNWANSIANADPFNKQIFIQKMQFYLLLMSLY
jgi:hypothetical protein